MTKTPHDFYKEHIGKAYDIDGWYGAQCWDGAMLYSKWLGYPVFHCGITGYVKDIWHQRKSNGILNYYKEVQRPYQDGDILIWNECPECPLSHIAIFRKDNGNGTFIALGQNQGGANGAFTQRSFSYQGVMGGFRPKCYLPPEPKKEIAVTTTTEPPKPKPQTYSVADSKGKILKTTTSFNEALESLKDGDILTDSKGTKIATNKTRTVFRLYNHMAGRHMFTISPAERDNLIKLGWCDEGAGWTCPSEGDPIFRLYNKNDGEHIFTTDPKEHNSLTGSGWNCESLAFYSGGDKPVYRLYNKNSGAHMLTTSLAERNQLITIGWKSEGEAFKAIS